MWNLGVRTPQHRFLHSFRQTSPWWIRHGNVRTDWLTVKGSSLGLERGFLFCQREQQTANRHCWLHDRQDTFPFICCIFSSLFFLFCLFFLLNPRDILSVPRLLCSSCQVCFMGMFLSVGLQQGHSGWITVSVDCLFVFGCWCFTKRFSSFSTLKTNMRPVHSLAMSRKIARKGEVVPWTSDTFRFIVVLLCHMQLFYMLNFLKPIGNICETEHSEAFTVQTMVLIVLKISRLGWGSLRCMYLPAAHPLLCGSLVFEFLLHQVSRKVNVV